MTDGGRAGGQALTEFAIVIPVFLTLLFAIVDVGRVVWASNTLANAAREATRFAIVHGGTRGNPCPVGPIDLPEVVVVPSASCPYPQPSKQAIVDVAKAYAVAPGSNLTVDVCYGAGCTGSDNSPGATNKRGTPVTVRVSSTVGLVTGSFIGLGTYQLTGSSTMLVNH
jgi:hypothetical protein